MTKFCSGICLFFILICVIWAPMLDISVSGDLFLNHGSPSWWSFHDANALHKMECEGMSGPLAIVVSEETPQGIIGETLSKFSIWSLYITFVLAVGCSALL
ncbi:hypothetical protein KFK09_006123 [Dendrobium nobile]|uniref:Piezo non-specific cation channel cap domain-containing protein n=1 Tax=Dendrobium nobile TaxID=94219 RepID=A0A8T3BSI8_DENNO|nr:hypothetical protein KFK09_006123 [Dendrobium nobile]